MFRVVCCALACLTLLAQSAQAQPVLNPGTRPLNHVDLSITNVSPTTVTRGQQVAVGFSVTTFLPISGRVIAELGGQAAQTELLSVTRDAPATGTLFLIATQAGSETLKLSFLPPIPVGCDPPPTHIDRGCAVTALSSDSQPLSVQVPTVHVRIAGSSYSSIAFKDSRDKTSSSNGYQCVSHDPGCGWWGNDGNDKFFATKTLPPGASIEGVIFNQYWPNDVDSASGSGPWTWLDSSGTYYGHVSSAGGVTDVKWNNTCAAGFAGKPLNYSISFLVAMPEGTDLGEQTFDPGATPNSSCGWDGYVPNPVSISTVTSTAASGWSGQILYCNATPASETLYLHIRATLVNALPGAQGQASQMIEDNLAVSIPPGGSGGSKAPFSTSRTYQQGTWNITLVYLTDVPTSPPAVMVKNPQRPQNLPMQAQLPGGLSTPVFDFRGGNCL